MTSRQNKMNMEFLNESSNSNSNHSEASASGSITGEHVAEPITQKIAIAMKKLTQNQNMKFMENFNPQTSLRERRKLDRKSQPLEQESGSSRKSKAGKATVYDEKGIHKRSGKDLCDCLDEDCPGCHFPCPKCRSCKCGHECRQNRKYSYDSYEVEGSKVVVKNKFK